MKHKRGTISHAEVRERELCVALDTEVHTSICVDMGPFLEHGRKFLPIDTKQLLHQVRTDADSIVLEDGNGHSLCLTYDDLRALVFFDPIAVSEKAFALSDQADLSRLDPELLLRAAPCSRQTMKMAEFESARLVDQALTFRLNTVLRPRVDLNLSPIFSCVQANGPAALREYFQEIVCGDVKIFFLSELSVAELYWHDLFFLTFDGEWELIAEKLLAAMKDASFRLDRWE